MRALLSGITVKHLGASRLFSSFQSAAVALIVFSSLCFCTFCMDVRNHSLQDRACIKDSLFDHPACLLPSYESLVHLCVCVCVSVVYRSLMCATVCSWPPHPGCDRDRAGWALTDRGCLHQPLVCHSLIMFIDLVEKTQFDGVGGGR